MALTRQQKETQIEQVNATIRQATSVVFMAYDGLTVADAEDLRDKLFETGSFMRVVPKRLLRLAIQNADLKYDPTVVDNQVAIVWGTDAVAPAKVIYDFAKEHTTIQLLAGVLEGEVLTLERVEALAKLPSLTEVRGQLVGVLSGPLRGLQGVLSGVQRQMVYVLTAIKEEKEKA